MCASRPCPLCAPGSELTADPRFVCADDYLFKGVQKAGLRAFVLSFGVVLWFEDAPWCPRARGLVY
jgi:hypothetical protein